jgi:hypothetical protein
MFKNNVLFLLGIAAVLILPSAFYAPASGSQIPVANIGVHFRMEDPAYPDGAYLILSSFEKEMRLRGFMGRVRIICDENQAAASGETLIKITITKNRWLTRKLFSIPYLLNRYRREYLIESFVEIPEGRNGMSIKRIKALTSSRAVAQYINNDKYDPALFPNQTEKLEMEENAVKLLAEKLSDHLFSQIR